MECQFAHIVQVFVKRRTANRRMLAFEVMYFMRQLARLGTEKLYELRAHVRDVGRPYAKQWRARAAGRQPTSVELSILVEHTSALMLECIIYFYLSLAEDAEALQTAQELLQICRWVPSWCSYIAAHGLYWAGRIFSIQDRREEARACFRQARSYKKYPFNINQKVTKVLDSLETEAQP